MLAAKGGNLKDALSAVKKENPIPATCGRVCPHPCVMSCNRRDFDEALTINEIERAVGDSAGEHGLALPEPMKGSGKKIAVVGAGPAGIACAYHAALMGHDVTIYERGDAPGGLLRYGIPEYRLPRGVVDMELGFIRELGITLKTGAALSEKEILELSNKYEAACVSVGAGESRRLAMDGENSEGVMPGMEFLRAVNGGSRVAPGKKVLVIGGGNTAMDSARCAARLGADVTVCYRRSDKEMPAFSDEIREALDEGVKIEYLAAPIKINAAGDRVSSVVFNRMRLEETGGGGRKRPVPIDGDLFEIEADAVLTAIGETLEISFEPIVSGGGANRNIYVAGDAGSADRTVSHALGSGKKCAILMDAALRGRDAAAELQKVSAGGAPSAAMYRDDKTGNKKVVLFNSVNAAYFRKSDAAEKTEVGAAERIKDFREINKGLAREAVIAEAARCFTCGCCDSCGNCHLFCPDMSIVRDGGDGTPAFKGDYCKGCGICAKECPRGVIEMVEEEK